MATKLYYLRQLFLAFLEPNDVIDLFQETGMFEEVGIAIREVNGVDELARRQRVEIFLQWFEKHDPTVGNKYQELEDVLNGVHSCKWLVPMLKDHEVLDTLVVQRLERLQKPEKVKRIFELIFPALVDINAQDVLHHMSSIFSDRDREEITKVIQRQANHHALYVLLCKLICKPPEWTSKFIEVVEKLGYNAATPFFRDSSYGTLAEALRDFFGEWDLGSMQEEMEFEEAAEPMLEGSILRATEYRMQVDLQQPKELMKNIDQEPSKKLVDEKMHATEQSPIEDPLKEKLRNYQKELSKPALISGANVVICERTGSGKTLVAAYIIDQHLKYNRNGKVAFFTPNGGLAQQQSNKLANYMPERSKAKKISLLRGNMEHEISKDFSRIITTSEIIVMTPQMLLNCIQKKNVQSVFDFTMMVFDECHHARASHPYCEILKKYHEEMKKDHQKKIQIIGLTATLGIGSAEKEHEAVENIFKLLGILDAKAGIVTVRDRENVDQLNEICPAAREETICIKHGEEDPFKDGITSAAHDIIKLLLDMEAFRKLKLEEPVGHIGGLSKEFDEWCQKLCISAEAHIDEKPEDDNKECEIPTLGRDAESCAEVLRCLKRGFDLCFNCQPSDTIKEIKDFVAGRYELHHEKNTEIENTVHRLLKGYCVIN